MANPHKSATRVHTDRPCSSVPSHRPHTPSPSTACDLYIVAKVAAPAIEITSITIQSFAAPRTPRGGAPATPPSHSWEDRKSTRLNSSHLGISYAVFCLKKTKNE